MTEGSARGSGSIQEVSQLVWGPNIRPELFARWSQGFIFSEHEKTALIQTSGGPCAVIAPVQAFLMKNLISKHQFSQLREVESTTVDQYLAAALTEMLCQCKQPPTLAMHTTDKSSSPTHASDSNAPLLRDHGPFEVACLDDPLPLNNDCSGSSPPEPDQPSPTPSAKDYSLFHSNVRLRQFESAHSLQNHLETHLDKYKAQYGVLLFLYSVILTKGVRTVNEEMGDLGESLIDGSQGHGGQGLINLLITGRASSYVWDGVKDVGGLSLIGILKRPAVGFLTRLEHLRYVQVGWYLKNPTNPVWVIASETHLSVLFSWCKKLVTPDSEVERAKQVFSWYDTEGNRFIQGEKLKDVLEKLNLCTDDDFIQFMMLELDPDNMGVILYHKFVETFFTPDQSYTPPDTFAVYHYNGLESSCPLNKIQYAEGCVTLQESHVGFSASNSEFLTCLATKWPNLDIQWSNFTPSLN
ncbi:ubiquitin carboxyl-terminal hydrolase MINDY-3-like isoform X2 [Procambarus clarkii]|uniref:ubiquitin carboxyl-terminal hydrolase MINDY-3 isoform X2 n=1 Tax=Procambarus clarkii TaxID=6728 RepID=UPI001E6786E2|nr:ubiquitin carboxyl-terminal hydrolase MINDY-3-like isoform X2 [Procambarus clarkii]